MVGLMSRHKVVIYSIFNIIFLNAELKDQLEIMVNLY